MINIALQYFGMGTVHDSCCDLVDPGISGGLATKVWFQCPIAFRCRRTLHVAGINVSFCVDLSLFNQVFHQEDSARRVEIVEIPDYGDASTSSYQSFL